MDGWVDGWMVGGWVDGWMSGWIDGWTDEWIGRWMSGWVGGWMSGWVDRWVLIKATIYCCLCGNQGYNCVVCLTERAGWVAKAWGWTRPPGQAAETAGDSCDVWQVDQGEECEGGTRDAGRARLRHEGASEAARGDAQRGPRGGSAQGQDH